MSEADMLLLLKQDLQRTGMLPGDDTYLPHLLKAARASLERQGVHPDGSDDYDHTVISTAAWLYRKRITGEAEPKYLYRMRMDLIVSQRARPVHPEGGT